MLVAGSVHLDIVGDITDGFENVDKIGTLRMSVGGSAFNIAANLAFRGHQVGLLSVVNPNSLGDLIIGLELKKRRIRRQFLLRSPYIPESGFIAHTREKDLLSAVSCMGVEQCRFPQLHLIRSVEWADLVAIEANVSEETISRLAQECRRLQKPSFACAVSESKVSRLFRKWDGQRPYFTVVAMNEREARKVGYSLAALSSSVELQTQLCLDFSANHVVITTSTIGYEVFSCPDRGQQHRTYKSVAIPNVLSTLGAGDALFASLVASAGGDWDEHYESVGEFLHPVLTSWSAVPEIKQNRHPGLSLIIGENTAAVMLFISGATASILGFFGVLTSYTALGCLFFAMSVLAGAGGALLGRMLDTDLLTEGKRDITFGIAAGLTSAFLLAVPYLLSGTSEKERIPLLRTLLLTGFIVSTVAGMTSREYLKRLQKNVALPDKLPDVK